MKYKILLVCMVVILVVVAVGCGGRSIGIELDGRWEDAGDGILVYEFSGDRFTFSVIIPDFPVDGPAIEHNGTFSLSRDGDYIVMERTFDDEEMDNAVSIIRVLDDNSFVSRSEQGGADALEVQFNRVG